MVQTKMEPNKDEAETKINSKASTFIKLYGGRGGEGRGGDGERGGRAKAHTSEHHTPEKQSRQGIWVAGGGGEGGKTES